MRLALSLAALALAVPSRAGTPDSLAAARVPDSTRVGLTLRTDAPDALGLPDPADLGALGHVALPVTLPLVEPAADAVRPVVFVAEAQGFDASRASADALVPDAPLSDSLVLPDRMPPYTRLFWGRRGLVRMLGLAPSTRRKELEIRRTMLTWHQRAGLVTWVPFTAQIIMGEIMAADGQKRADLGDAHETLGITTFAMYMGTATLSLGAPPGRRYSSRFSSTKLHKYLALVHFTGMAATPFLGSWVAEGSGTDYDTRLRTHQWVSRVTYAAYTAALATMYVLR